MNSHHTNTYPLPSSPTQKVLDRFSLLPDSVTKEEEKEEEEEDATSLTPLWPLLRYLLTPPGEAETERKVTTFSALADLLDTIAVTVHGTSHPAGDYALLREAIASHFHTEARFFTSVWPRLADLALQMPALFPAGTLPVLGRGAEELVLSRRQAACLVVHMFLRTVVAPEWKDPAEGLHDFGVWYGMGGQRQEGAVRVYLGALMRFLEEAVCRGEGMGGAGEEWFVRYSLRSVGEEEVSGLLAGDRPRCWLGEVEVEVVGRFDTSPTSLGMPGGAAVVAANRYVGFGQSATQEEVHVGSSPEACPAVLVMPPLRDDQVLIVKGAQAMVNITGQRRDIKAEEMPVPDGGVAAWRERTMLFMDALELDMVGSGDSLPDLRPANLEREIRKAYTAFSSCSFREIRTGLWGCGVFCGDPGIKMLLLWLATSLTGTRLVIACDSTDREFAEEFRCVVARARGAIRDTAVLWKLLNQAPSSLVRGKTLSWVVEQLDNREQ